ncbi:hypothetical protein [Streptomyces sp. NPDC017993]
MSDSASPTPTAATTSISPAPPGGAAALAAPGTAVEARPANDVRERTA